MSEVKNVPNGWVETTLGEVVEIGSSKRIFFSEYVSEGIPFYRSKEIIEKQKGNNISSELFITEKKFNEIDNQFGSPKKDDLLLTSVGTLGVPYLVKENEKFYFKDGNLTWFKQYKNLNPVYLYNWILSPIGKERINSITIGSTQSALTISGLRTLKIYLPPLPEQQSIAAILTSFDDKIELLQAQNKTLEELAQTLFKEWFGKYKVGDELPDGWRVGKLSEFGKIICGKTPSKSNEDYFGNDIPFIKIPDMHNKVFILETTDNLSIEGAKSQNNKMLPKNSICISCIATVGLVSITTKKSQTNQQINSIIPNENYFREFLYFTLTKMKNYLNDLGSGGTATLNVNTSTFSNIELVKPKEDIIKDFHKLSNPIFEKVLQNNTQIQTLTKTRDALLPKLMSGEIRVKK